MKSSRSQASLSTVTKYVARALLLASAILSTRVAAAAPSPRRPIEVQSNGLIDTAVLGLASELQLSEVQQARVRTLMQGRATTLKQELGSAAAMFLTGVNEVLTGPQKRQVTLEDVDRWNPAQWQDGISELTGAQAGELKRLFKLRHDAILRALNHAEDSYEAALADALTPTQQKNLLAGAERDPIIRIPMR